MKKLLSLILACMLIIGIAPVQALAASTPSTYEFNQDGLHISVAYLLDGSAVTEKTTIAEDNATTSVVERVITPDGTLKVYMNGSLQKTSHSDFYGSFLNFAQGNTSQISHPKTMAYGCGISASHSYVRQNSYTIDMKLQDYAVSGIVAVIVGYLDIPAAVIAGEVTMFVRAACTTRTEYIDVTESQYYVHDGAPNQDLECYHVYFVSYNRTSSGGRDVFDTQWEYYQYYI